MALLTHIIIAISSVLFTAYVWVRPSQRNIRVSYVLLALTIASGTYLVVSLQASMLHACLMGLLFVGMILVGTVAAQRKLAAQTMMQRNKQNQ